MNRISFLIRQHGLKAYIVSIGLGTYIGACHGMYEALTRPHQHGAPDMILMTGCYALIGAGFGLLSPAAVPVFTLVAIKKAYNSRE